MPLKILTFPDKRLQQIATIVANDSSELQSFIKELFTTMYEGDGIGLAATQVGSTQRLFVLDISESHNQPQCFINPEIIERSGQIDSEEGCLSFPDIYVTVKRAANITVRYLDQNFNQQSLQCDNLLAICIQHEIEHLDGITLFNKLSPLKQERIRTKLFKQQQVNH